MTSFLNHLWTVFSVRRHAENAVSANGVFGRLELSKHGVSLNAKMA
jgi:hypothetical protein